MMNAIREVSLCYATDASCATKVEWIEKRDGRGMVACGFACVEIL